MQINLAYIFLFILAILICLVMLMVMGILVICTVKAFNGEFAYCLADILCGWLDRNKLKEYLEVEKYINRKDCWKIKCNCNICSAKKKAEKENEVLYAEIYKHRSLFYRIFYIVFILIFFTCIVLVSIWICKIFGIDLVWNLSEAIEKFILAFKK